MIKLKPPLQKTDNLLIGNDLKAMNCCWVTIHTTDLDKSVQFYTEVLGLHTVRKFSPAPGRQIVFLQDENGFCIELIAEEGAKKQNPEGISVGFTVPSLTDALAVIRSKSIELEGEPVQMPNLSFFFVKDPNGVTIQFVESKQ